MLLGSVAEDVIRHSRVPVLTLKTPLLLDTEASEPGSEPAAGTRPAAAEKPSRSVLVF